VSDCGVMDENMWQMGSVFIEHTFVCNKGRNYYVQFKSKSVLVYVLQTIL
jgi:hypothetical protein